MAIGSAQNEEPTSDELEPFSETEDDLGKIDGSAFDATVHSTDWTTETILNQMSRGTIELTPEFQRRDAWDRRKKSRFVESLIVGLPVPQIVLAERKGRKGFIVLDGKQRLLTLRQFTDPKDGFRLVGLDLRPDLNGKTYSSLPEEERTEFETQTIRTIVVRNWRNDSFLYIVFLRLNTESVALSPQELRQALRPGPFVSFVNGYTADNSEFYSLFRRNVPDFRMRDVELLVRFFAFDRFLPEYVGNLKPLLDMTCERLNESWPQEEESIREAANGCRLAIKVTLDCFGENAFRRWNDTKFERPFNRAVFDAMTFYARSPDVRAAMMIHADDVVAAFKRTCEIPEFAEAITTTTKSREAIVRRLTIWGAALSELTGLVLPIPVQAQDGRIGYAGN